MLLTREKPIIINKPEYKFQTVLFLPHGEGRKGEGGLRTKGFFKHSYRLLDGVWYICDTEGNPVKEAPKEVQEKIEEYVRNNKESGNLQISYLPLISVITVVLNGEKYLEETIQSVINQTYPNVEYIVIDGGSTDGTLDIIKKYEDKIDYWISERDNGIYDAMNKGISIAVGEWIGFLGSDDYYESTAIESLIKPFYLEDQIDVVYGNSRVLKDKEVIYIRKTTSNIDEIKKGFIFFHPDSIVKSKVYKLLGFYDTSFKIAADYDFFLKAYFAGCKFRKIDQVVVNFRLLGTSSNYIQAFKEKLIVYKKYKKLGYKFLIIAYLQLIANFLKRILKLDENSFLIRFYKANKHKIGIP